MRKRAALLALLCLPASVIAQTIDLGSAFSAISSLAKSQQVANMSEAEEIQVGRDIAAATMGGVA